MLFPVFVELLIPHISFEFSGFQAQFQTSLAAGELLNLFSRLCYGNKHTICSISVINRHIK